MIINSINLNLLRIFEAIYRNGSMTKASKELFMTQSGVSQNIKNLEELLETPLFDRIKQKTLPTLKGHELYKGIKPLLIEMESVLASVIDRDTELIGELQIGLPIEYGNNVIVPLLTKWCRLHPGIKYKIKYGHATDMNTALLKGELDMAVVDNFGMDKQIKQRILSDEELILCCSKKYFEESGHFKNSIKYFEELDYIDYVDDAPILKQWFKHHFHGNHFSPQIRASLMNVQGISKMITEDFGLGILPLHVVTKLKKNGSSIHLYKGSGQALHNSLSLATLHNRSPNPLIADTAEYLFESLN
jgi:DNA-binding transcriptional LysR family regulator